MIIIFTLILLCAYVGLLYSLGFFTSWREHVKFKIPHDLPPNCYRNYKIIEGKVIKESDE